MHSVFQWSCNLKSKVNIIICVYLGQPFDADESVAIILYVQLHNNYARTKIFRSSSEHTTSHTFTEDSYKRVNENTDIVLPIDDKVQR